MNNFSIKYNDCVNKQDIESLIEQHQGIRDRCGPDEHYTAELADETLKALRILLGQLMENRHV